MHINLCLVDKIKETGHSDNNIEWPFDENSK